MKQVIKATHGKLTVIVIHNEKTDKYLFYIINPVLKLNKKTYVDTFNSFQEAWEEATRALF